jgi:hypothetical protein
MNVAMATVELYAKTAAGAEELRTRERRLPPRLRTMLLLVDGTRSTALLQRSAQQLGAPDDFLAQLQAMGLITVQEVAAKLPPSDDASATREPGPAAAGPEARLDETQRFRAAQKYMNDTVVDAMGIRAFFFTLKLEKCFTRADLSDLLPEYVRLIARGNDEGTIRDMQAHLKQLLA